MSTDTTSPAYRLARASEQRDAQQWNLMVLLLALGLTVYRRTT